MSAMPLRLRGLVVIEINSSGCYYGKSLDILQKINSVYNKKYIRKEVYVWNCWICW